MGPLQRKVGQWNDRRTAKMVGKYGVAAAAVNARQLAEGLPNFTAGQRAGTESLPFGLDHKFLGGSTLQQDLRDKATALEGHAARLRGGQKALKKMASNPRKMGRVLKAIPKPKPEEGLF